MGYLVITRNVQGMRRARTFQRRAKKLVEKEKGKSGLEGEKLMKGIWYFPYWPEVNELFEEAKFCGLKEGKDIIIFEIEEIAYAPKWLIEKEKQHKKEVEETTEKFLNFGKEHQK